VPKDVSYGGSKKDSESLAAAKGKNGKSFVGELVFPGGRRFSMSSA